MKKFYSLVLVMLMALSVSLAQDHSSVTKPLAWTILQSWDIPGKASGLAHDGTYLYFGIYGSDGDHVYRFNPATGNVVLQFTNPAINDSYGMTWDGSSLWITDHGTSPSNPAEAIELDLAGNIVSSFNLPDHYMSGIAYDAGDFWVGTYYPDPGVIYKVNNSGSPISQFVPPADQIWDICTQGTDLWMVDYNADMIYRTNQSGAVQESHPCENIKPSGIVHDGTYLWYVDGQLSSPSKLYKVSLTGSGTPEINIPVDFHNYGVVSLGDSETWQMEVENIGDADLEITNLVIPSAVPIFTSFNPPQIISPGSSIDIPLTYAPTEQGPLSTTISVQSTDPINPSVDVDLVGNAVYNGPYLNIPYDAHDYGDVRIHAYTRWFLELENLGDATLIIDDIQSDNEVFIVDESVSFPIQISTLDSALVGIWFNPKKEGPYMGQLTIASNDSQHDPYIVPLDGVGLKKNYPIGDPLWNYMITTGYDQSPKAIAPIEDITGDTVADVIICSEDDYIRCFNGNSSGIADVMWAVEIDGGTNYDQPGLTTIDDINNDGYHDVILGTAWADRSIIAFSGKTGEEIWKHDTHEYGNGGWVYAVDASHDYNNDGTFDVLACTGDDSEDMGPKRVYCLNAYDGVSIWECYIGGPVFSVIGVNDFTGDGVPDVIAGASSADETEGRVYGINGANGGIMWMKVCNGSSVWALAQLDDFTGDGVDDIVAGDFSGYYYLIDPTSNTTVHQGNMFASLILRFDRMDDVNGDGYADVLVAHSKTNAVVMSGFDGSNIWLHPLEDKSWNVAVIDDLNNDAINDVLVGTLFSDNYCYYLDGTSGEELKSINYITPIDAINAIPDIVGDGSMEMVAGGRNGKVYCYSGGLGLQVGLNQNMEKEAASSYNYPNPFIEQTSISFDLEETTQVQMYIIDISGKQVKTLLNQEMSRGEHEVVWKGDGDGGQLLPTGFYFYEIKTQHSRIRRKMIKL